MSLKKDNLLTVIPTTVFVRWLDGLRDRRAASKVAARIVRIEAGNFGGAKSVGGKVSEVRVDYGPGYRVYFTRRGDTVVILLVGGDKSTQRADIAAAQMMAEEVHRS